MIPENHPEQAFPPPQMNWLISSFHHWTGRHLIDPKLSAESRARALFTAPFGVVAHNTDNDPIFNYGNQTALELFEIDWSTFTRLPSRQSAEPVNRQERDELMSRVTQQGYIDDYRGVRISSSGNRFMLEDAIVWNIIDDKADYRGQAAVFYEWSML